MEDKAWYVVASMHSFAHGLSVSQYDPVTVGSDPVVTIKRYRLALERHMKRDYSLDVRHHRAGSMYAVWRFDEKLPQSRVKDALRSAPVWRVFVITDNHSWQGMAELCLPEGVSVFDREAGG